MGNNGDIPLRNIDGVNKQVRVTGWHVEIRLRIPDRAILTGRARNLTALRGRRRSRLNFCMAQRIRYSLIHRSTMLVNHDR